MYLIKYLFFLFFIPITGCGRSSSSATTTSSSEEGIPVIDVEKVIKENSEFYLSDIAQRIEYIPLEFTPECPVKMDGFFGVHVSSRDIFVLSKEVYHFDGSGKFLNRIGRRGNGPGEYTIPLYLTVDTIARRVYILSNNARLVVFDYDGKHIRTIQGEKIRNIGAGGFYYIQQTNELATTGDGSGYHHPDHFFFKVVDTLANTRFVKKALLSGMLKQGERTWWDLKSILDGDDILALDNFSDTIFRYRQSVFEPYMILNYGRYKITFEALMSSDYGEETGRYFRTWFMASTPKYLFLRFRYGNSQAPKHEYKFYYIRYDKVTGECISQKRDEKEPVFLINDLDAGMPIKNITMNHQNQWFVAYDAIDMMELLTPEYLSAAKVKDPQAKERLKQLVGQLTENDNPVLMRIILK